MDTEIQKIINTALNQQPKPILVTITKIHTDNTHVDIKTKNNEELTYIPTIGTPTLNHKGVLMFLEDESMIIITGG